MKKQNFLQGALILVTASLIVKIFGAIFKIPLTNIIGVTSMAYFNTAYGFYVIFYMISTAGIPVAISKMISAAEARNNQKEVDKIFRVSYILFFVLGIIGSLIMIIFSTSYANYVKLSGLEYSIMAISPTLFFICITSAYRGYFQGMKNMLPTAISQIIGATGKLFIGLVVAIISVNLGASYYMVAAYTILGITVGSIASTIFLWLYKKRQSNNLCQSADTDGFVSSTKSIVKTLINIAIPVTLSATILSLTNTIDTTLMVRRLNSFGTVIEEGTKIMGAYTSMSVPLFNLSPNLIYPFAISVIPTITALFVNGDKQQAEKIISSTFRIASIIAIPCSIGLSTFARPIISLLYTNKETINIGKRVSATNIAAEMLSILAIAIFFCSMVSVTNAILQAHGLEKLTIISTVTGIVFKIILNYTLIGTKSIGFYGAPVATLVCYLVITLMNFVFLIKNTNYTPRLQSTILKPLLSSVVAIGTATFVYKYFSTILDIAANTTISILIAVILYFLIILLTKSLEKDDILMLPKGEKIAEILAKMKFLS